MIHYLCYICEPLYIDEHFMYMFHFLLRKLSYLVYTNTHIFSCIFSPKSQRCWYWGSWNWSIWVCHAPDNSLWQNSSLLGQSCFISAGDMSRRGEQHQRGIRPS